MFTLSQKECKKRSTSCMVVAVYYTVMASKIRHKLENLKDKNQESKDVKHSKKNVGKRGDRHHGVSSNRQPPPPTIVEEPAPAKEPPPPKSVPKGGKGAVASAMVTAMKSGGKLSDTLEVVKDRVMVNATEEMILAWKYQAIHVAASFNLVGEDSAKYFKHFNS